MNTAEQLSTTGELNLHDAAIALIEAINADAVQSDQLLESLERKTQENSFLALQVSTLKKREDELNQALLEAQEQMKGMSEKEKYFNDKAAEVTKNAQKHMQMLEQANREKLQALNKVEDLTITLKDYKSIAPTAKAIREKIKDYKERVAKNLKLSKQHKNNFLEERKHHAKTKLRVKDLTNRLGSVSINQIYSEGNDIVAMYPYRLGENAGQYRQDQVPLLYMNTCGRGGLVLLNEEDEPELVEAPKGGLRPKKSTLEHCGQLLRRFKARNWELDNIDLDSIALSSK